MATRSLSDIQIEVRIVPKRVQWPAVHSSPVWIKAQSCVHALEDLVRNVDSSCLQAGASLRHTRYSQTLSQLCIVLGSA